MMRGSDSRDNLAERADRAANAPPDRIAPFFKETAKEILVAFAHNPNLQERDLLRLLERKDLPAEAIKVITAREETAQSYALKLALARHPHSPRSISLPLMKFLFLFDLVRVCQSPGTPTDVKMVAEENILKRLESVPRGEKITLARQSPGRVAAALLVTDDRELIAAALGNPFLTEAHLVRVLGHDDLPSVVVEAIARHDKWSRRYHLRLAMIRNPLTPLPRVLAFIPDITVSDLNDICHDRRMSEQVRKYILARCSERLANPRGTRSPGES